MENVKIIAKRSRINSETIRMYRNKGLILPQINPDNGYYEYSEEDFFALLEIKRLRSFDFSLEDIHKVYYNNNIDNLIDDLQNSINDAEQKILELERSIVNMRYHKDHLLQSKEAIGVVKEIISEETKYDFYDFEDDDQVSQQWVDHVQDGTYSVFIDKEYLNLKQLPKKIPIKVGIGTYEILAKEHKLPLEKTIICPPGKYLTMIIKMNNFKEIEASQIQPLIDEAKKRKAHFISSTTGFLIRFDNNERTSYFRIRAQIDK